MVSSTAMSQAGAQAACIERFPKTVTRPHSPHHAFIN
jgi:hypothetical protein